MSKKFDGIAFDLDGTIYANARFYVRLIPFALRHGPLLLAMGRARKLLHRGKAGDFPPERFYDVQAELMAKPLGRKAAAVKAQAERLIYRGWESVFGRVPLLPHVREALEAFRGAGLKVGLLSDFPPEKKLVNFGIRDLWDVILCSEVIGRLKPDPLPFRVLAEKMELPPERILYVGNSVRYDVKGAKAAGMGAALIRTGLFPGRRDAGGADFVFSGYRQLAAYVLD